MNKEVCEYNIQVLEGILNQIEEDLRDVTHKLDEIRIKKLSISYIVDYLKKELDIVEDKKTVNLPKSELLKDVTLTPLSFPTKKKDEK